ncbi:dephospho-CoA kinase [Azoarcus olearius]|uniref:Dephospho-CoA kinase n=1 Tax=Azoarcus sp. (strain BH72) TaxID=418699 RepID=A1K3E3_AZOSB|nr:dephospho-CoA kinase [Azoarcus olearius]CAL93348.1 CoaE protein [Azoarcus olearius]
MKRPYVVGLSGGIGSGKSAAADRFAHLGATLVDTDAIAHALTGPGGAAMPQIAAHFGSACITADGRMDREAMRALVFSRPAARRELEAILHPMIRTESDRQVAAAPSPYVILAIPLLVESGTARARCDRICIVDCPEALQIERVRARSGLEEAQILAIMQAQASRAERLAVADDVIDNSTTLSALHAQVDILHARYLALAGDTTKV